ncbi:50S ribosomal protein L13 [Mycoplasmopsis arginini]|uniref:Large ribosomal subunit protein uL13 n=1 Tax=Mycoplasmopsis arginini TaxID=2094 RepID=A0AA43U1N6_MYCAR|nr:50S ribosomal protein L13 [Mycoplasmopsis arginini]ENY70076.1 50S ribosomal protein L13 [Mycoplasmopsis arginini 7264]MCY2902966.1 50S ribosomal protein L13 [Mycoplasmopsis arginini QMP CG1-2758]MDI3348417.1 50S ribosomal protein L13 [Mycoplasmopsis arginini]MDI3349006.1 50S ribosomal protein L13 [Mycoplasmopsis arginini]MDI3349597.1 50S ribosomal protein L13 [Mycoplasmopsis arginini]
MRQTTIIRKELVDKKWYIIDAANVPLGRLSTLVASILRGKNKPTFTPNVDMGDNVVVINAKDVLLTAKKDEKKIYYHHTGYPGGLKQITAADLRAKKPEVLVEKAVRGMLPHTKLGRKQFKNLYVYANAEHKQVSQQPTLIEVK